MKTKIKNQRILSIKEAKELNELSQKLFGSNPFKIFTEEEIRTSDYQRYEVLLKKKLDNMKLIEAWRKQTMEEANKQPVCISDGDKEYAAMIGGYKMCRPTIKSIEKGAELIAEISWALVKRIQMGQVKRVHILS